MAELMQIAVDRLLSPWWRHLVSYAPYMAGVFVIERLLAARPRPASEAWLNLRFIVTALLLNVLLLDAARQALAPLMEPLRLAFADVRRWVATAPPWAQYLAQVAAIDFFYYWTHRAQHRFAPLWRLHELHHSDPGFDVTTTLRVHWLEELMKLVTVLLPAALLVDAAAGVPVLLAGVGAAWLFFIHANARISFGPLDRLLVSPAVHRVHHSREPEHRDRNFAVFFSLWDVLFGTYRSPPAGRWPEVGTEGAPPASAWGAHLRPLRLPARRALQRAEAP